MVSRAVRLSGTDLVDPPMRTLTAGPISAEFDNGALRYIRFGGIEVLRAVAFLVRDENWGTFIPALENLRVEESADRFVVTYRGACADAARTLVYDATITGGSDGSLDFEVVAYPRTDVLTNRTGFIVLHPADVAGQPVRIIHVDGREEESRFPQAIDPRCPFRDVRSMSHPIAPGVWATCTMEGDAYETEDQRNWGDASYKTYIRPLTKPWPYVLPKGEPVSQAVRLAVSGAVPAATAAGAGTRRARVAIGGAGGALPAVGVGVPAGEAAHTLAAGGVLQRLGPSWLACEVDLRRDHGRADLERCRALAELTGAEITLEIITRGTLDPRAELASLAEAAAAADLNPAAVSVFPAQDMKSVQPDAPWPQMPSFEETYAAARAAFPGARLGGGMAAYFTELNRKRPPAAALDYVTHTTCATVHAADDRSVMETVSTLPHQIASTRGFMGDLPYRIGPSHIGCRENPYGSSTAPNPGNARVCLSPIDPRQRGLFNAAWALGYIAACARGGLEAVALGAPTGSFGHIHRPADFAQPYFDTLDSPAVFPSFHVIAGLAPLAGAPLLASEVSPTGAVEALALRDGARTVLWLANPGDSPVTVDLPPDLVRGARIVTLDAGAFEALTRQPDYLDTAERAAIDGALTLDAYAVARITAG